MSRRQIQAGVPYRLESGVKYWSRIEVKDLVMYLRLVASPTDNLALLRVINVPARKLGSKSVERLAAWAEARGCTLAQVRCYASLVRTPLGLECHCALL